MRTNGSLMIMPAARMTVATMTPRFISQAHELEMVPAIRGSIACQAQSPCCVETFRLNALVFAFEYFGQRPAEPSRRWCDLDPGLFHRRDFGFGVALAASNDGAGMAHAAARRSGPSGDEADHRLVAAAFGLIFEELRGIFFRFEELRG